MSETESHIIQDYQKAHTRFLRWLQLFIGLTGFIFLIFGLGRIALERSGNIGDLIKVSVSAEFMQLPMLIIGGLAALTGYLCIYTVTAIGAKEPPALSAIKYSLRGIMLTGIAFSLWLIITGQLYLMFVAMLFVGIIGLAFRLLLAVEKRKLWQVFGQPIHRRRNRTLWYLLLFVVLVVVTALAVIHAILVDTLELPLPDPEPGELIYLTTFDQFNDEWDTFADGEREAKIQDEEMILRYMVYKPGEFIFVPLTSRRFRNFDLRVKTTGVSGDTDNGYGVLFRMRDNNRSGYLFEISSDGYYRLSKLENGQDTIGITQWIPSESINPDYAANEIRIVARDAEFSFFINGNPAQLCMKGSRRAPTYNSLTGECDSDEWRTVFKDDSFSQGYVALSLGVTFTTDMSEPIVVAFDNLIITGPENDE